MTTSQPCSQQIFEAANLSIPGLANVWTGCEEKSLGHKGLSYSERRSRVIFKHIILQAIALQRSR